MSVENQELRRAGLKVTLPRVKILQILEGADPTLLTTDDEWQIALALADFPDRVRRAVERNEPCVIAAYVLDLCRAFSSWYAQGSKDPVTPNQLRFIRAGSAHLPPDTRKQVEELFSVAVIAGYGSAEAAHITNNPLPPGFNTRLISKSIFSGDSTCSRTSVLNT